MEIWNIVSSLATPVALLALFYQIYYDRKQQLPKYEVHIRAIQIRDQYGNIIEVGQVMTISFKIPNKRIRKISYAVKDTFENIYTSNELVLDI